MNSAQGGSNSCLGNAATLCTSNNLHCSSPKSGQGESRLEGLQQLQSVKNKAVTQISQQLETKMERISCRQCQFISTVFIQEAELQPMPPSLDFLYWKNNIETYSCCLRIKKLIHLSTSFRKDGSRLFRYCRSATFWTHLKCMDSRTSFL